MPKKKKLCPPQEKFSVSFNQYFEQLLNQMKDLQITLIQSDLHWENIDANLSMFEEKIWQIGGSTDVIILPEMFTTGFSMKATSLAEIMGLRTTRWMRQMADQTGALILGSFIAEVHERYYNRLIWMEPGGQIRTYDKRHLFRMGEENQIFSPGESLLIGTWKDWRICPLICYDLRFPVWSRNRWNPALKSMNYDLLVYMANWPMVRSAAWETLLHARAIENLSYVAGVNRVGIDGNNIEYNGKSGVIGPAGESMFSIETEEVVKTVTLSAPALQAYRERFPAFLDGDDFSLNN